MLGSARGLAVRFSVQFATHQDNIYSRRYTGPFVGAMQMEVAPQNLPLLAWNRVNGIADARHWNAFVVLKTPPTQTRLHSISRFVTNLNCTNHRDALGYS
jgi:hypothetical protein